MSRALERAELSIERGNAAGLIFALHKLQMGLISCRSAQQSDNEDDSKRYGAMAARGLETAIEQAKSLPLTTRQRRRFDEKVEELRAAIDDLSRCALQPQTKKSQRRFQKRSHK